MSEDSGPHRLLGELRATEHRLGRICDVARIGVIEALDPFGPSAVDWSDTTFEILGAIPREGPLSLWQVCSELVHPDHRSEVCAALERTVTTLRPSAVAFRVWRSDETLGYVEAQFGPERVPGESVRWLAVLRDVTTQRRLEQELRHAQKMEAIARLTAGVAHEYNNLLMGIQGCAGLALRRLDVDHPATHLVAEARRAADRGSQLTHQLLRFGAQREPARGAVDLDAVVERTSRMLHTLLGEGITVSVRLGAPSWRFVGDEDEIEQALVNLALNARDAMPDGGALEIVTGQGRSDAPPLGDLGMNVSRGECLWLSVSDDGVGMDEVTCERAFEPFFTTKDAGRGLGLSMVYGVARAGGDIAVQSELGAGTTVTVAFPRAFVEEGARELPAPARSDPRAGHERILLVEDEELIRLTLKGYLRPRGYTVEEACDVFEASLQLSRGGAAYDSVISDVMLPGGTGQQVYDLLRGTHPDVPIVFMSAYPRDLLIASGRIPEDARLMQKPFDEPALMQAMREALGPSFTSYLPPPLGESAD